MMGTCKKLIARQLIGILCKRGEQISSPHGYKGIFENLGRFGYGYAFSCSGCDSRDSSYTCARTETFLQKVFSLTSDLRVVPGELNAF